MPKPASGRLRLRGVAHLRGVVHRRRRITPGATVAAVPTICPSASSNETRFYNANVLQILYLNLFLVGYILSNILSYPGWWARAVILSIGILSYLALLCKQTRDSSHVKAYSQCWILGSHIRDVCATSAPRLFCREHVMPRHVRIRGNRSSIVRTSRD